MTGIMTICNLMIVLAVSASLVSAEASRKEGAATLRLPFLSSQTYFPVQKIPANRPIVPRHVDAGTYIWDAIPWEIGHDEFIRRWNQVTGPREILALAGWCKRKRWPVLAEYSYRRVLSKDLDYQYNHPLYKKAVKAWRPLAEKRIPEFVADFPLRGEWRVVIDRTGHHYVKLGAAFAVDLVVEKDGKAFSGRGRKLSDHHAWNQPVHAGIAGKVIYVNEGHDDLPIGKYGGFTEANAVIIDNGKGVRILHAHLKKGSIVVKQGDQVSAGALVGTIGNSGRSGVPHLHMTFLDNEHVSIPHRFRFEIKKGNKWVVVEAGELPEGSLVRPAR